MKVKYLLVLALALAVVSLASAAFAAPFTALQYNVPLTVTSVPVPDDFSQDAFSDIPTLIPATEDAEAVPAFWAWAEILEASLTDTASTEGVVKGYGDGSYQPGFEVTRSMMAVFLANGLGLTTEAAETPFFDDVPDSYWAYTQVQQCAQVGLVLGYTDFFGEGHDAFLPAATVTRDQMAVFLVRATVTTTTSVYDGQFTDIVDEDSPGWWAKDEIVTCVDENIALGYPNAPDPEDPEADTGVFFAPARKVTRDQMAVFVWRALIRLNGNCVVLGGPAMTDTPELAPAGTGEASALFLPTELGGLTGANIPVDEEDEALPVTGDQDVVFVVLDAAQVPTGDIVFEVSHVEINDNGTPDDEEDDFEETDRKSVV